MAANRNILWADDEIELLQPHIIFLGERGYEVHGVTSGEDAVKEIAKHEYDALLLDEQMAGLDGIATLSRVKKIRPDLPVIMITKSEEESLMEEAIGGKIDDYLTKPVNPSQILSALKKLLEGRSISAQRLNRDWVTEFNRISDELNEEMDFDQWLDMAERLAQWDIEITAQHETGLKNLLEEQVRATNAEFARYIESEYPKWMKARRDDRPALSRDVVREWVLPLLNNNESVLFLVLDGLRLDHWIAVEPLLRKQYNVERELYYSVLPTATPYSRNSLFGGFWPCEYPLQHPDLWDKLQFDEEASANRFERQVLDRQLEKLHSMPSPEPKYAKILDPDEAYRILRKVSDYFDLPLVSMVFNFVDIVAHHRSTEEVIQTLIPDEAAYRSIVRAWFEHSPLFELITTFLDRGTTIVLTSDHGSTRVRRPAKVVGDREASTNIRYKIGRNLRVNEKQAIKLKHPDKWGLASPGVNIDYLLAREDYFFVYPNEFNKYADKFRDSFLHGGISMEEMVVPLVTIKGK